MFSPGETPIFRTEPRTCAYRFSPGETPTNRTEPRNYAATPCKPPTRRIRLPCPVGPYNVSFPARAGIPFLVGGSNLLSNGTLNRVIQLLQSKHNKYISIVSDGESNIIRAHPRNMFSPGETPIFRTAHLRISVLARGNTHEPNRATTQPHLANPLHDGFVFPVQ